MIAPTPDNSYNTNGVLDYLFEEHAFNRLKDSDVKALSELTGIDCEALCRQHGIVYWLGEPKWEGQNDE